MNYKLNTFQPDTIYLPGTIVLLYIKSALLLLVCLESSSTLQLRAFILSHFLPLPRSIKNSLSPLIPFGTLSSHSPNPITLYCTTAKKNPPSDAYLRPPHTRHEHTRACCSR